MKFPSMIEADIKKLEEIVKKMESGELSLEQMLATFGDGITLVKKCTKTLEEAELKVKEILQQNGQITSQAL